MPIRMERGSEGFWKRYEGRKGRLYIIEENNDGRECQWRFVVDAILQKETSIWFFVRCDRFSICIQITKC